ncbi:hypothetical protein SAMN05444157_2342 [Frankineae bacterium MT45]|nr:hypothetical protein SAMN05444157_2342 [Frankineae bacterium MT45]
MPVVPADRHTLCQVVLILPTSQGRGSAQTAMRRVAHRGCCRTATRLCDWWDSRRDATLSPARAACVPDICRGFTSGSPMFACGSSRYRRHFVDLARCRTCAHQIRSPIINIMTTRTDDACLTRHGPCTPRCLPSRVHEPRLRHSGGVNVVMQNGCPAGSSSTLHRSSYCGSTSVAPSRTARVIAVSRSGVAVRSRCTTDLPGHSGRAYGVTR